MRSVELGPYFEFAIRRLSEWKSLCDVSKRLTDECDVSLGSLANNDPESERYFNAMCVHFRARSVACSPKTVPCVRRVDWIQRGIKNRNFV